MRPTRIDESHPQYEQVRARAERACEELWEMGGKHAVLDTLQWIHMGGEDPLTPEEREAERLDLMASDLADQAIRDGKTNPDE